MKAWRRRQERKRRERDARELQVRRAAFAVVREIAEPLIVAGLAELRELELELPGPSDDSVPVLVLDPLRHNAAKIEVGVMTSAWVDLSVGPKGEAGGANCEIDTDDGWDAKLRAYILAVIDGRYIDRIYRRRLGEVWDMVFDLADGERAEGRLNLSGAGYGKEPGEYRYAPYA